LLDQCRHVEIDLASLRFVSYFLSLVFLVVDRTAYDVHTKEPRQIIEQDDGKYTCFNKIIINR